MACDQILNGWTPVPGFSDYEVHPDGLIRRVSYQHSPAENAAGYGLRTLPSPLKTSRAGAYRNCVVDDDSKRRRTVRVHRLILLTFRGVPQPGMQAAHLDGDGQNNRLVNLVWATTSENAEHRRAHQTMPIGSKHANAKLDEMTVRQIRLLRRQGMGAKRIAKALAGAVSVSNIEFILAGKTWRHVEC